MASITERKTGDGRTRFLVQVRLKGHPPQTATFDRKSDAKKWAQTTEAAIREGRFFPRTEARKKTLGDAIDGFLSEELPALADTERRNRVRQLRWWRDRLGAYCLAEITPSRLADCLGLLVKEGGPGGRPVSTGTRNRYHAAISAVLKWAMRPERGWLEANTARRVNRLAEPRGRVRYLSEEERERLLTAAKANSDPRMHLLILLAVSTGARESELMGLKWSDLDLTRGLAFFHETKNDDRKVSPIRGQALEALREWARSTVRTIGGGFLFGIPGETYGEAGPRFPRKRWEKIRDEAGLKNFRFHDLRHTTGSYLAMSGATPREIMEVLGHRSLAMAARYSHLATDHVEGVVERMAGKFL